jgi:hypothetical protein
MVDGGSAWSLQALAPDLPTTKPTLALPVYQFI